MSHSEEQARAWIKAIRTMVRKLDPETAAIDELAKLSRSDMINFLDNNDVEFDPELTDDAIRKIISDGVEDGTITPDYFEHDEDKARDEIMEHPLSVEYRSGWVTPGSEMKPEEFCITLCTGGPEVRIIGDICNGSPDSERIEHRGWGTPWAAISTTSDDDDIIRQYCQQFIVK